MKKQFTARTIAILLSALLLQACNTSRETTLRNEDELGALIASLEAKRAQQESELEGEGTLRTLNVTASAYNSLPGQTDSRPNEAAWGDILKPGMKAIAVSRDLLAMGMTRNTRVKIKGLPGTYRVLDKMNRRWSKKIDIYMGNNRSKAMNWGRRQVEISWYSE